MSDAALSSWQRAAQRSLLGVLIAGLAVFPAAWLVLDTPSAWYALSRWGAGSNPAPELGSARVENESLRLISAHQPRGALTLLEPQLKLDPGNAQLWCNTCVAHGLLRQRQEAVAACSRAVALQPFTPLFVNNLAWVRSLPEPRSDAP
jgi:Flp pilus assembly protein TadD